MQGFTTKDIRNVLSLQLLVGASVVVGLTVAFGDANSAFARWGRSPSPSSSLHLSEHQYTHTNCVIFPLHFLVCIASIYQHLLGMQHFSFHHSCFLFGESNTTQSFSYLFKGMPIVHGVVTSRGDIDLPPLEPEVSTSSSPKELSLAKHLRSIGAKMYGAFWCSHCFEQKQVKNPPYPFMVFNWPGCHVCGNFRKWMICAAANFLL